MCKAVVSASCSMLGSFPGLPGTRLVAYWISCSAYNSLLVFIAIRDSARIINIFFVGKLNSWSGHVAMLGMLTSRGMHLPDNFSGWSALRCHLVTLKLFCIAARLVWSASFAPSHRMKPLPLDETCQQSFVSVLYSTQRVSLSKGLSFQCL